MPFMPPFRPATPWNPVKVTPISYGPGAGGGLALNFKNPIGGVHIFMPPVTMVDHRPPTPPPVPARPAFQPPKLEIPPIFHVQPVPAPSARTHPPSPSRPGAPPHSIAPPPHHFTPPSPHLFTPPPTHYSPPAIPHIFRPPPTGSTGSHGHFTWPWHCDKPACPAGGDKWNEIYEKLKQDPNPLSGLPQPRTQFEAHVKQDGSREGYEPIWDPSTRISAEDKTVPHPIGYRQTFGGFTRYFDIGGILVGTSEIPIEPDDLSPVDLIPFDAIGSIVKSAGQVVGSRLLAAIAEYAAREAGDRGGEVFAKYLAKETGASAGDAFAKFLTFARRLARDEVGALRIPGTGSPQSLEVGERILDKIAASKEPLVIRDMPIQAMEALKQKYGPGLAYGLRQKGTVMSYEAASAATEGLGGAYQAHHVAEVKVLKLIGHDSQLSPSVLLTAKEHAEISARLDKFLPKGEIQDMTKQEIFDGYKKAYQGHAPWLAEVKNYFPGVD
jgi:hypothetical protein